MKKLALSAAVLVMVLVAAVPALAQVAQEELPTEPESIPDSGVLGFVTSISGTEVLVEVDPADQVGSTNKGYFTVTGETTILRQQGDELIPATFEELAVGQLVSATYSGPILTSYPSQGAAGSIVILEELPAEEGAGIQQYDNAA